MNALEVLAALLYAVPVVAIMWGGLMFAVLESLAPRWWVRAKQRRRDRVRRNSS